MIPRVIHRVWLGADEVPAIFEHYAESWRKHHPAWELRLWRDETLPTLSCQAEFERETGFKKRYDIVRLEILRQFGGVIVDMDVEAIRPLDPLLAGVSAFVGRIGERHIGNQVLGAIPNHPFFEHAVTLLRSTVGVAPTASDVAGKEFLRRLLIEHPEGVTVFPPETFYFQPTFDPPRRPDDFPAVYAVHHELASYAAPLAEDFIERRLAKFAREVASVEAELRNESRQVAGTHVAPGEAVEAAARLQHAEARRQRAEQKLRRAVLKQEQGYQAALRRVEAEREQAEARLREAQRDARLRIEDLEKRLEVTAEQLTRRERRSLFGWARRRLLS